MANFKMTAFVSEMQKIVAHWTQVNAALPTDKYLVIAKDYTLTDFQTELTALQQKLNNMVATENQLQGAMSEREIKKTAVRESQRRFRQGVQGRLDGTKYVAMLPLLPVARATEGVNLKAFQDVRDIWQQIDADTVLVPQSERPFVLAEGYGQSAFVADLGALTGVYNTIRSANSTLSTQRKSRDERIKALRKRALLYGKTVRSRLPEGHALTQNLPSVP
jgi:hypothetical protein